MTFLVGLNTFINCFSSGRQFRAVAGTTRCLAACHSLVGSTPSCFRGHIFSFHLRLAACIKYFYGFLKYLKTDGGFIHSFHWHVQNVTIPCRSQELIPFLSVIYFFLPPFSTNYSSILPHFILPSISLSSSQSCCFKIHV